MRVLVVEDEVKMASLTRRALREDGMLADVAVTGADAIWMATTASYDAIVLDVMLPDIDGFETCRRLREQDVWAPVLMLTARDSVEDRVAGLDGGADDYVIKPVSFDELFARIRALIRRGAREKPTVLTAGELRLDPAAHRAWRGEVELRLTAKEFTVLEAFMRRPGELLAKRAILEHGWDYAYEDRSNVVEVCIGALRNKIDRPFGIESIETVRGAGYRLRGDGGRSVEQD
jgi:two-component system OmpR family response regulator